MDTFRQSGSPWRVAFLGCGCTPCPCANGANKPALRPMRRSRVGSPLSLASIGRDLAVSPVTLKKYLDILEALYIVFVMRPFHDNIARAVLQTPKVYFYDNGLVVGDDDLRFENLVATALHKQVQWQHDVQGQETGLHYIRTKDGAEVDFALSHQVQLRLQLA